eukprot:365366-Chlamydomonas_euryale.AAC.7
MFANVLTYMSTADRCKRDIQFWSCSLAQRAESTALVHSAICRWRGTDTADPPLSEPHWSASAKLPSRPAPAALRLSPWCGV